MSSRWQKNVVSQGKSTSGPSRDDRIANQARTQKQLIGAEQLRRLGLSDGAVQNRIARRRLHRVHFGVYALHPPPYSREQIWLAAVLACGPGSLLSDLPAASHLGLIMGSTLPAQVTNASGRGRGRDGIIVHRRLIDRRDVSVRHGVPCTSPARTIIDSAHEAGFEGTEEMIMAADSLRILNRRRLQELADEHRGRPGIQHVSLLIIDDPVEARGVNERRMLSICREFGVATPLVNHRIDVDGRTFYADFCWPAHRLIVEADSWRWHGGRSAQESDSDRGQLLSMAGWQLVRFTRDQIKHRRTETGSRLNALTSKPVS